MLLQKRLLTVLVPLMFAIAGFAQNKPAVDYLHVPGPVSFDKKAYSLSWSSHPSADFYKQEYLVKGDDQNNFHSMILMDAITGQAAIKEVVGAKLAELKKMKESNPLINYDVINNPTTGEYLIDFLLTANAADGSLSIAERNVYRYKNFTDKAGHKGVLLFGVSNRVYGQQIKPYLTSLKSTKSDLVNKIAAVAIPEVSISK